MAKPIHPSTACFNCEMDTPKDCATCPDNPDIAELEFRDKRTAEETLDKTLMKTKGEYAWYLKNKPGFKEAIIKAMEEYKSQSKAPDQDVTEKEHPFITILKQKGLLLDGCSMNRINEICDKVEAEMKSLPEKQRMTFEEVLSHYGSPDTIILKKNMDLATRAAIEFASQKQPEKQKELTDERIDYQKLRDANMPCLKGISCNLCQTTDNHQFKRCLEFYRDRNK